MKRQIAIYSLMLMLSFLSSTFLVAAQSKPNLSGTWKMNAEKSKFERGGPKAISIKFDQQESTLRESLTLTNERGEQTHSFTYSLDGKESPQQLEGREIKATAKWEGATLVIEFKNDDGFNFSRKISVSGDGKIMTIDVKQTNAGGSANDTVILERQ
jgi:hypothetical protein